MKKIIKKLLPEEFIWYLANLKSDLDLLKIKLIISNRFFVLLNMIFQKNYINEHYSFLQGAYIYESSIKKNKLNIHFLRRNIHRIEKGMLMRPRRDVYALRFILPTLKAYKNLVKEEESRITERSELEWSRDVLKEYFRIVKSNHKNYVEAYKIFNNINNNKLTPNKIPYKLVKNTSVDYENFYGFNLNRKSVRWFKKKRVPDSVFTKALEIASLSPSSCNRSPYKYIISNKNLNLTHNIAMISQGTVGWSQNIPSIVVLVGKQRSFSHTPNRHSIYVDSCLSVMPFLLALESLGLNSCIINWADIPSSEGKMNTLLSLEKDEKVILSIAVGYGEPSSKVAFSQRKRVNEISEFI